MRDERDGGRASYNGLPVVNREEDLPEFTTEEDEAVFWATHQLGPDLLRASERRSLVELLEIRAAADRPAAPSRRLAAASDARIPGLERDEAARLRDRLAELGEAQAAGL